jgi:hypothetical protein
MDLSFYDQQPVFRSRLSFQPLVRTWKRLISAGHHDTPGVYTGLVDRFSATTRLLHPIDNYELIRKHQQLIDDAVSTIFAPTLLEEKRLHAIATPFSNQIIYASPAFRKAFMEEKKDVLLPWDDKVEANIRKARVDLAYKLILKKIYGFEPAGGNAFICAYPDPRENIHNYFELTWDHQFIEVIIPSGFVAPSRDQIMYCHHVNELAGIRDLRSLLPLEEFIFDGIMLIQVKEVTQRESSARIHGLLQEDPALEEPESGKIFKEELGYLLGLQKPATGFTSFISNGWHSSQPFSLIHRLPEQEAVSAMEWIRKELQTKPYCIIDAQTPGAAHPLRPMFNGIGRQTILFMALYTNDSLSGCFELCLPDRAADLHAIIVKLRNVLPDLQSAMQQNRIRMQEKIDRLSRDHFTAVQPAVEWKFNEAAIHYLLESRQGTTPKMEEILFEDVFPLYAAIDIRNSSTERNKALQQDLLTQLLAVKSILVKARQYKSLPLLDELLSEAGETIESVGHLFISSGEQAIYKWLQTDVADLIHVLSDIPELKDEISSYFSALEPPGIINHYQRNFESSITVINDYLSHFLDREQPDAQAIYPHYFERFASDGIEFNLYIGQSISPGQPFKPLYLQNLRLWQLKLLALAARHLYHLKADLLLPLETTQLIMVYNKPISISFRTAERKFDVDGIYNARYEVVKKRIDKAYIRNSNERLTRPGTISIVYFNERDAEEYNRHINFLRKEQLLEGDVEKLELEDLQGVNGLKALRVSVCYQAKAEHENSPEEQRQAGQKKVEP